jgi:hypothetical protein
MVRTDGHGRAELRITGANRPPLDGLGQGLDQAVLQRVAGATIRSLLRSIAATLAGPAAEATGPSPLAAATVHREIRSDVTEPDGKCDR